MYIIMNSTVFDFHLSKVYLSCYANVIGQEQFGEPTEYNFAYNICIIFCFKNDKKVIQLDDDLPVFEFIQPI